MCGSSGGAGLPALRAHEKHPQQTVCLAAWSSAAASLSTMAATATSTSTPDAWASPTCAPACRSCWTAGASPSWPPTSPPPSRPSAAITDHHLPQPPRRQQLARQRQHAAQQRAADRVAELGFDTVRAYLVDRLVTKAWTLAEVMGELGAAPATVRRPLEEHQVRRVTPTRRQRAAAAAASGPQEQARAVQSAARHAWPNLASQGWRSTYKIGMSLGAGRCGGCAPKWTSVMAGWTSS